MHAFCFHFSLSLFLKIYSKILLFIRWCVISVSLNKPGGVCEIVWTTASATPISCMPMSDGWNNSSGIENRSMFMRITWQLTSHSRPYCIADEMSLTVMIKKFKTKYSTKHKDYGTPKEQIMEANEACNTITSKVTTGCKKTLKIPLIKTLGGKLRAIHDLKTFNEYDTIYHRHREVSWCKQKRKEI